MKKLYKYGLAYIKNNKLLLCKPCAFDDLILPGGMKKGNETYQEGLQREIYEELGSHAILKLDTLKYLGNFKDIAAGRSNTIVEIELYLGVVSGELVPSSEIEKHIWWPENGNKEILSPIIENKILPFIKECLPPQNFQIREL